MFLTPQGAPFFGGTYFPKDGRYGLPGFLDLLPRVAAAYREQGDDDRRAERRARATRWRASSPTTAVARAAARRRRARARGARSARSTRCTAGSAARPSSRTRPSSTSACARTRATATPEALAIVRDDARADGGRRHPRSARRRLLPLQRRRASGRSRTSRRCSTTTGRCSRCTRTSRASPATRRFARRRARHRRVDASEMRATTARSSSLDADSEGGLALVAQRKQNP